VPQYEDLLQKEGLIRYEFSDFSGGLNTKATRLMGQSNSDFALKPNQLVECINWEFDESGGLVRRKGWDKFLSTGLGAGVVVHTVFELVQANGSHFLLVGADNKLYLYNTGTGVLDLKYTAGFSNPWKFAVLADLAVGVNGADSPIKFDGATVSLLGGPLPATATDIVEHRNRLFGCSKITLHYTDDGAPTTWTGTLPLFVGLRSFTARFLSPMYDRLVIGMDSGLNMLTGTGPTDFAIAPLSQYQGGVGPHGWATVGDDIHYLSERGIHSLASTEAQAEFGDVKQAYVSNIIEPTFKEFPQTLLGSMRPVNRRTKSQLMWMGRKGSASKNSHAIVWDYFHGAWTVFDNFQFASGVEATVGTERKVLLGGYDGQISRQTQGRIRSLH